VKSFPCVEKNFGNVPVSSFRTLANGFTQSMPAADGRLGAEAADDVWLDGRRIEVMVWVDDQGQTPEGHVIGPAEIAGQHFAVWNVRSYYAFVLDYNEKTGQIDVLAFLRWLVTQHDIPPSATVTQVSFGWEIADTGGGPRDFTVTRYWLNARYA